VYNIVTPLQILCQSTPLANGVPKNNFFFVANTMPKKRSKIILFPKSIYANNLQRQKKQILQKLKLDLLIDFVFCGYMCRERNMFKCVITEHFGPFCGRGGYGSETKIGISRSPKKAVALAKGFHPNYRRSVGQDPVSGICGGGVPILGEFKLYKNGKLIADRFE